MKVGILSLNMYTTDLNYACRVHSYAFQKFLDQNHIDNVIIDYVPNHCRVDFDLRHPYDFYEKHPMSDEAKQKKTLKKWKLLYEEREQRYDLTQKFIEKFYRKTEVQYTTALLDKMDPECDIYICATDVLWKFRPRGFGFDKAFFLQSDCMKGKGKIAFAVSYGGVPYTDEQLVSVKNMIRDIDFISTREEYLFDILNNKMHCPASIVIDPVFLQEAEFYDKIAERPKEQGYVLVYTVIKKAPNLLAKAVEFAQKLNLEVIELSEWKENSSFPQGTRHEVKYGVGIEGWLGYIKYADYVFTNSFHCCCFAIIFQKRFYAGDRTGTKISWLLDIFNLSKCWLEPDDQPGEVCIDYTAVDKLRKIYRDETADFILQAIRTVSYRLQLSSQPIRGIESTAFMVKELQPVAETCRKI